MKQVVTEVTKPIVVAEKAPQPIIAAKKEVKQEVKQEVKAKKEEKTSEKSNDYDETLSPEEEWILKMPDTALNRSHSNLVYSNLV